MIAGRHDTAERKQAQRHGREKGCRVYIAAEQLEAAGIDPNGPKPWYRVWAGERGRFIVTLYGAK
jgi:hypothetical protein